MKFDEALQEMLKGKNVVREAWNDGSYLTFMPGMQNIWQIRTQPNPAAGNWLPLVCDLDASDFVVMDKVPEVKAEAKPQAANPA